MNTTPLKAHRLRAGLSQNSLAKRAGITFSGVSRLENGHRVPKLATAVALAVALECDPADLFPDAYAKAAQEDVVCQ